MHAGVFLRNYVIPSETSLSISWELGPGVTPTSYNITYYNINTQCFNDSHDIFDIDKSHTNYKLTGLEEGSEYFVSINVQICEIDLISEDIIISSTLPNGQLTLHYLDCSNHYLSCSIYSSTFISQSISGELY